MAGKKKTAMAETSPGIPRRMKPTLSLDVPNSTPLPAVDALVTVTVRGKVTRVESSKEPWNDNKKRTSLSLEYAPADLKLSLKRRSARELEDSDARID